MSCCVELRRAKPLLGTFVEIRARAEEEACVRVGLTSAFAAVSEVHRLMSFHEPTSDVTRLNREAFSNPIRVHQWTWQVLARAQEFAVRSRGAFDITIAPLLSKWGYLPENYATDGAATFRDVILEEGRLVRFRRPLSIDLGGIAKGFAVDRAVECLQKAGIRSGTVNAGGDLRVFGPGRQDVHLRSAETPGKTAGVVGLRDRAIATSGIYFSRRIHDRSFVSPLVNGRTRQPHIHDISVAVSAPECVTADALTKVVLTHGENSRGILHVFRANAILLERDRPPRVLSAYASQLR